MATYKVPQNVEADDKLIGPFTFRQFIYLLITAGAIFAAYGLSRIFIGLILIPLPIIILFGVLALPLKKDQPMETYLLALIRFWTKPRIRIWDPEGTISMVDIVAPRNLDDAVPGGLSREDASQRLSYLSQVVDTRGWSTKGVTAQQLANTNLNDTYAAEAQNTVDLMDDQASIAQSFDSMIDQRDEQRRQAIVQQMQQYSAQTNTVPAPTLPDQTARAATTAPTPDEPTPDLSYNPYPASMHQHVVMPAGSSTALPEPPTVSPPSPKATQAVQSQPSPDIINLANNKNLSVETLANEARRLADRDGEEVVIKLH